MIKHRKVIDFVNELNGKYFNTCYTRDAFLVLNQSEFHQNQQRANYWGSYQFG